MARNLLSDTLLDLMAAFDHVEGNGFFDRSIRNDSSYGLYAAIRHIHRCQKICQEKADDAVRQENGADWCEVLANAKAHSAMYDCFMLYGSGGWHRYRIDVTGRIQFSLFHGTPATAQKARNAGFEVF